MLFLSVTFVFELRCVTAVTAKKQNLWGIYARVWQARTRGVDQDTETLSIREQGH